MDGVAELDRGLAALREGDWLTARNDLLAASEVEQVESGLEGLALAAWWLDDGPVIMATRERLFRLHSDAGDPIRAANAAVRLAWDIMIVDGDLALAGAWLSRARRLLADADAGPVDRGWCDVCEAALIEVQQPEQALALVRRVLAVARSAGDTDLEVMALAEEGEVLLVTQDVRGGLARLEEAAMMACTLQVRDPLPVTMACCCLLHACATVRDYDRANRWLERITRLSAHNDNGTLASIGRFQNVPILLGRGLWRETASTIEDALQHFAGGNPPWERNLVTWLADLRRRQGRRADALRLLDRAEPGLACRVVRAALALDDGDHVAACAHASAFLRQTAPQAFADRGSALEVLGRAEAARGHCAAASDARERLGALAEILGSLPLRAAVRRTDGAIAQAQQRLDTAREAFEDAVDLYSRGAAPYEAARSRLDLAAILDQTGRPAAADAQRQIAHDALAQLAAATSEPDGPLSRRETEVLRLVAEGLANGAIAQRLTVSPHTVHRHIANILAKLSSPTRAAAVAAAAARGLL